MKNRSGFTLIELLAVIIILGVLLLVAIPTMNGFIDNAKKDTFISTAKQYITTVRYMAIQGDVKLPDNLKFTAVSIKDIELDQGSKKSAFNEDMDYERSYILITNASTTETPQYTYYYVGVDKKKNGVVMTKEADLERKSVQKGTVKTEDIITMLTLKAASTRYLWDGRYYTRDTVIMPSA